MDELNDLGTAIAYLRDRRSQAEVAEQAGIDRTTWSLYEAGKRRPRAENLEKVLAGLGCSRLELEEMAWRFRRQRLLYEERLRRRRGSAEPSEPPPPPAPGHRTFGLEPVSRVPASLVRREVQEMLARLSDALEEFVVYILTEGR